MIDIKKIHAVLRDYKKPKIATVLSHSSLQIFLGAKLERMGTIGIGRADKKEYYEAFPLACPDEFIEVDRFADLLSADVQDELIEKNAILIPTGSFVEYVGAKNIQEKLYVPEFGNRLVLEWESDRKKQRKWLEDAGLRLPLEFAADEIDGRCIVKFYGAKGGRDFFTVASQEEFHGEAKKRKLDMKKVIIQEFISGNRYYPSFFYSPTGRTGLRAGKGRVELICVDRRDEVGYSVVGNIEMVYRESLVPQVLESARAVVDSSVALFPPGMIGPFCIETVVTEEQQIYAFEISARIVAGTNVAPMGSAYSCFSYKEPMSMGRRIAREIKKCTACRMLDKIVA